LEKGRRLGILGAGTPRRRVRPAMLPGCRRGRFGARYTHVIGRQTVKVGRGMRARPAAFRPSCGGQMTAYGIAGPGKGRPCDSALRQPAIPAAS